MTVDSSPAVYYTWSEHASVLNVVEIWRLKDNRITTLIFWSHMTSSVTWPFDSRSATYAWSIVTMRLFWTVVEIWSLKRWTDGGTNAQAILYSVQCIGQTIINMSVY